ncbi:hypothetical protein, partial [Vulcaniibacterium tengchongense]
MAAATKLTRIRAIARARFWRANPRANLAAMSRRLLARSAASGAVPIVPTAVLTAAFAAVLAGCATPAAPPPAAATPAPPPAAP